MTKRKLDKKNYTNCSAETFILFYLITMKAHDKYPCFTLYFLLLEAQS